MAIAQPDVVGPWGIDTSLALSRPGVQCRDGHACHVVDFFGGEHLAVSVCGDRHVVSPKAWRDRGVLDVHSGAGRISLDVPPTALWVKFLVEPVLGDGMQQPGRRALHQSRVEKLVFRRDCAPRRIGLYSRQANRSLTPQGAIRRLPS